MNNNFKEIKKITIKNAFKLLNKSTNNFLTKEKCNLIYKILKYRKNNFLLSNVFDEINYKLNDENFSEREKEIISSIKECYDAKQTANNLNVSLGALENILEVVIAKTLIQMNLI